MAHRLVRTATVLAATAVLALPVPAYADSGHDHASPSADPHAGRDMVSSHGHDEGRVLVRRTATTP